MIRQGHKQMKLKLQGDRMFNLIMGNTAFNISYLGSVSIDKSHLQASRLLGEDTQKCLYPRFFPLRTSMKDNSKSEGGLTDSFDAWNVTS